MLLCRNLGNNVSLSAMMFVATAEDWLYWHIVVGRVLPPHRRLWIVDVRWPRRGWPDLTVEKWPKRKVP